VTDQTVVKDPLDSAMDAEYTPRASPYFGQLGIDVWYAALEKGKGKVDFDPTVHSQDRRVTAIKISMDAYKRDGSTFLLEREMIAESKEWASIVKPSLRAIGADLRGINEKWAKLELVSTGQTYTNKNGETKQRTTVKFLEIFATEETCQNAAEAFYAGLAGEEPTPINVPAPAATGHNAERDTAEKFLAPLWKSAGGDLAKFEAILAKTSPVNKYFSINSPEVLKVISL